METLAEFIWKRMQELTVREAEHQAALAEIRDERTKLRRAAMAAGIATNAEAEPQDAAEAQPERRKRLAKATLKQAIIAVLQSEDRPMIALDILREINTRFEANFLRSSLSPQLSRLKNDDGLIDLDGQHWFLTEKGKAVTLHFEGQADIFG